MIDFEDFADDGFGLTITDLVPNPLPDLPPRWEEPRWWSQSGHQSLEEYAAETIRRYARPTLHRLDAGDDEAVFPHRGAMVSLTDLVKPFDRWSIV